MYCTVEDLKKRKSEQLLIILTNPENKDAVAINEAVANEAIEEASSLMDSYLGVVGPIPVNPVPAFLTSMAAWFAIHELYSNSPLGVNEALLKRYDQEMEKLRELSTGKTKLPEPQEEPETVDSSSLCEVFVMTGGLFQEDNLKGF